MLSPVTVGMCRYFLKPGRHLVLSLRWYVISADFNNERLLHLLNSEAADVSAAIADERIEIENDFRSSPLIHVFSSGNHGDDVAVGHIQNQSLLQLLEVQDEFFFFFRSNFLFRYVADCQFHWLLEIVFTQV